MTTGHYLRSMKQLTNQWSPSNFRDERRQRLYLKDIDCPPEWHDRLRSVLPPNLFYLNENVEQNASRRNEEMDMFPEDHVTAPAGDLMSSLPPEMRAQNLMCYIGHEGTYTPAHKEMCASLGQNIMIDASGANNGEKVGSSIWFMTETKDREVVREYFLSMLGHDIEIEKHFAQINAWKKATFPVYIVEQKVGDFILIPPLAPHQVWNRGTRTMKVAWNRTTVETLEMALHEALPKARLVCRDEQYKNKAIVYFTLKKYRRELLELQKNTDMAWLGIGQDLFRDSPRVQQLLKDFKSLFGLYTEILVDEMFMTREKEVEYIEFDSCITCSYCRANIFNRFLTCKHCVRHLVDGSEDTYDVCMECYAMGRSCLCISGLSWCEQWKWSELVDNYEDWRTVIIRNDGFVDLDLSPMPLEVARRKYGKKPVAQICQEQLKRRPWKDITKHDTPSEPEPSDHEVDDEGRPVKKKRRKKKKKGDVYRCHVCSHKEYTYKLAFCSTPGCGEAYCYGVLHRAFDLMPQAVMQNENWKCPKCLQICNCGYCRRLKGGNPYMPKNTLLGHDTRPIADDRSVEALVDFRLHNLTWLKNAGDESRNLQSKRMQRLRQAAEAEKAKDDELVNSIPIPALANGDEAASPSATTMKQPITNGFDDQVNGPRPGAVDENDEMPLPLGQDQPELQALDTNGGPAAVADMSLMEDESTYPDPSSYPDPSMLGHERMLGMGYYQQDDSPDKILFDPYHMPSADAMSENDLEMTDYVKKALRAAKRRARQEEDDDPDFAAPRSWKRARLDNGVPYDGQQEALNNMDPALFAQDSTMLDALDQQDAPAEPVNPEEADQVQDSTASLEPGDERRSVSPHRPALRPSRPKMSYAELFDGGEEEFNEVVSQADEGPEARFLGFDPENANRDPPDLASVAIRAMSPAGDEPDKAQTPTTAPAATPAPVSGKRRGRPPGRPRKSDATPSQASAPASDKGPSIPTPQASTGRKRGRPRRSLANEEPSEAVQVEVEHHESPIDHASDELEAQLAKELEAFDENGEQIEQPEQPEQPDEPEEPEHPVTRQDQQVPSSATKRRGRPPKNAQVQSQVKTQIKTVAVEIRSSRPASPPPDMKFLSMKERMALRGKKFKIAKRKSDSVDNSRDKDASPATVTPRAGHGAETAGRDFVSRVEGRSATRETSASPFVASSSGYSSRSPPPRRLAPPASEPKWPPGPTIVRLGDTEDEYESEDFSTNGDGRGDISSEVTSEATSDFEEDEDIPARKAPVGAARHDGRTAIRASTRGGRAGRPRGRGRGRWRGRGRG